MQEHERPAVTIRGPGIEAARSRRRPWMAAAVLLSSACGGAGAGSNPKTVEVQSGERDGQSAASAGAEMDPQGLGAAGRVVDPAGGDQSAGEVEAPESPAGMTTTHDDDDDEHATAGSSSPPAGGSAGDRDGSDDEPPQEVGSAGSFRCPSVNASATPWAAGAQPGVTLVQGGFRFLEGPVWVASRNALYFSDMLMGMGGPDGPPANIHRLDRNGEVSVFVEGGNSNGLSLAKDGRLLAATHDLRTLSYFDLDSGERETLALDFMGEAFNSPNDLAVRTDGQIYFTDPDWQRAGRPTEIGMTGVYRIDLQGRVRLIDDSLDKPNGISFSPDESVLYVSSLSGTYRYNVEADGEVSDRSLFAPVNSDGMVVDCAGYVYLTAGDVQVFSAEGDMFGAIAVDGQSPTNVAFGGPENRTLFITAGGGIYRADLDVPGLPY